MPQAIGAVAALVISASSLAPWIQAMAAAVIERDEGTDLLNVPGSFSGDQVNEDLNAAMVDGRIQFSVYARFDPTHRRLIGPLLTTGRCLQFNGQSVGTVTFYDPALQVQSGDVVLIRNTQTIFGSEAISAKILEHLAGRWWGCSEDGLPPVEIGRSLRVLGVLVASAVLPADCESVRWAERWTEQIYAQIPDGLIERCRERAAVAIAELEDPNRTREPVPYPIKLLTRPDGVLPEHFWRTMGLSSMELQFAAA